MRNIKSVLPLIFLTALTLQGCATAPDPTHAFLSERLAQVDTSQPCYVDPFVPAPVMVRHHQIYMLVSVNGVTSVGTVDTGASFTLITPEFAAAAGVALTGEKERMYGVAGSFASQVGSAKDVKFGTIGLLGTTRIHVAPFAGSLDRRIGVNIGLDWLEGLDYDLDLHAGKITAFRTSNCLTVDPPWRNTYSGVIVRRAFMKSVTGYTPDLSDITNNRQISIPVIFGKTAIEAEIDTGSTSSFLSHEAALDAGASNDTLEKDEIVRSDAIDRKNIAFSRHMFHNVVVGEDTITDFPILVARHFDRRDTAMLLGMDFVATHHLWLSFTTSVLYIDSGEPRKLTEPLGRSHWIAGSKMPGYPPGAKGEKGEVKAQCMVEAGGELTACKITSGGEHTVLAKAVLHWLTSAYAPVLQPTYRDGKPVREMHSWDINFAGS